MALYIAEVKQVIDETDGERIKVRLLPADGRKRWTKTDDNLTTAFPLLPKMLHIKPKVGESVLILTINDDSQYSQCFYIGPIISQPQFMNFDSYYLGSGSLLNGAFYAPSKAPSVNPDTHGSYAKDEEIAIYGRRDTDIILGDKDLRIRCGARKFKDDNVNFEYNKRNPSYVKLSEFDNIINRVDGNDSNTTVSIVADEVNILSHNGKGAANVLADQNGEINGEDAMREIIEKAHVLPYGDVLVDFLTMFLQMFKSHTHKYANLPPCPDEASKKLDLKYGTGGGEYADNQFNYTRGTDTNTRFEDVYKTFDGLGEKLLSKHVRIN